MIEKSQMQTVLVELEQANYPIYIGAGLLSVSELLQSHISNDQVLIITNQTVAPLYLEMVQAACKDLVTDLLILPDGEQYKSFTSLNQIFDSLLSHQHRRNTTLLALGGGVIGDLTGFAAACYMRGVAYLQLPTTLLAQVDSAIGGKTAVNHALGKNMIGAFHQPQAVICDLNTLMTLSDREYRAGLAEVIKYGLIYDAAFFAWLEKNMAGLLSRNLEQVRHAVLRSCEIKSSFVVADEHEMLGIRSLLNFGHTFGHAIENALGYGTWLHGEAVAVGMLLAADLSAQIGWISHSVVDQTRVLLTRVGLPTALPPGLTAPQLLTIMAGDKKNIDKKYRLVLLSAIGKAEMTTAITRDILNQILSTYELKPKN